MCIESEYSFRRIRKELIVHVWQLGRKQVTNGLFPNVSGNQMAGMTIVIEAQGKPHKQQGFETVA